MEIDTPSAVTGGGTAALIWFALRYVARKILRADAAVEDRAAKGERLTDDVIRDLQSRVQDSAAHIQDLESRLSQLQTALIVLEGFKVALIALAKAGQPIPPETILALCADIESRLAAGGFKS